VSIFQESGYDITKLRSLLKEAVEAYDSLLTGKKAVKVERNGRMVEFTKVNKVELKSYIDEIQRAINPTTGGRNRRPARISF
tara:strand:- start:411 stop:656 length:246 start_codon:yes stop_codon:yes gene_type:complete